MRATIRQSVYAIESVDGDEQVARQSRARSSVRDLGAFESTTTSDPVGPYGNPIDAGADAPVAIDARPPGTGGATATGGVVGRLVGRGLRRRLTAR
jgi:hypothetical protein